MSGSVNGFAATSSYGLLGRLVANGAAVRQRLDTLSQQASTGKIAGTYAGLGAGARVSLDLNPAVAHQETWRAGIDQAVGRMQVTETAMTQIQKVAADLYAKLNNLNGLSAPEVDSVAAFARDGLRQVAGLLDTKNGDNYVFAGQDSGNPPVPQPDDILASGFYTQIAASVGQLAANGGPATAAATLATAGSNAPGTSPFSASLSQPPSALSGQRSAVPVGDGQSERIGLLASANASVASAGSSTTGSYMRDVMRALATVGSLGSGQLSAGSAFSSLVADTRTSLGGAITAMGEDVGAMGDSETRLGTIKTQLGDMQTALKTQISNAEDVDMASTLSQLALVQTQMQASYQMIASLGGLSLVKFLTAA